MVENPFIALTFIAGPAVLTNACAIMQNSATMRYTLAISQWREFRASLAARDDLLAGLYVDAEAAMGLAERRIRLLLRGLNMLYGAVGLFGVSALLGLVGAMLASTPAGPGIPVSVVAAVGAGGVATLVAAAAMFMAESRCARALLLLQLDRFPAAPQRFALA